MASVGVGEGGAIPAVGNGAELRRYGKPHIRLRQEWERAEHFGGGQGTESRALRSAGVGSHDFAGRSLPVFRQQTQQANCYHDQHDDEAPRR